MKQKTLQVSLFNHRRPATALIISLMMISAVGALIFGAARIFLANAKLTGHYEDINSAFYSAESGIELAMLDLQKQPVPVNPQNIILDSNSPGSTTPQKVSYRILTQANQFKLDTLSRGAVTQVDVAGVASLDINWSNDQSAPAGTPKASLELLLYNNNGERIVNPPILLPNSGSVNIPRGSIRKLRLIARKADAHNIVITPHPHGARIGSGDITIEALGQSYGGASKRRLRVKMKPTQPKAGFVYTLFDYLLYSGEDLN